jgi:hypothetical protein
MSEEATLRFVNESAIREHALQCSKQFRNGKFTRVGEDFMDEVKADVACFLRDLRVLRNNTTLHDPLPIGNLQFATGALMDATQEALNRYIGRTVQNKVQKQPSCGCTLSRTR